jgi:hypothetical protein
MPNSINIDQLADEIVNSVQDYTEDVQKAIEKETRSTARKIKNEIKENSPRSDQSGEHYADGWSYSTSKKYGKIVITVYNKDKPQLTHLLENGHAIAGGTGRVEGIPHIGPAEKKYIAEYQKNVNKILENGG